MTDPTYPPISDGQRETLHHDRKRDPAGHEDCWACEAGLSPTVRHWAIDSRTLESIQDRLFRRYGVPRADAPYFQIGGILQNLEACIFTLRPDLQDLNFFDLRAAILGPEWVAAKLREATAASQPLPVGSSLGDASDG